MNRGALYYLMIPLILLLCLLQSTAAARFRLFGVKPDLVLLLVLVGSLLYGGRPGVVWAFIGGLGLDVFSGGPMGASSLALMAAALVAGLGHRPLFRYNIVVPLSAAFFGTFDLCAGLSGHPGRAECERLVRTHHSLSGHDARHRLAGNALQYRC